eukprot:COSAG04_NODE_14649_length_560_cov_1.110629_1_plen_48_part_10
MVTDYCNGGWPWQGFTHVSGSLGGGAGYMCAGSRARVGSGTTIIIMDC